MDNKKVIENELISGPEMGDQNTDFLKSEWLSYAFRNRPGA